VATQIEGELRQLRAGIVVVTVKMPDVVCLLIETV
jgi:hypothetical protein